MPALIAQVDTVDRHNLSFVLKNREVVTSAQKPMNQRVRSCDWQRNVRSLSDSTGRDAWSQASSARSTFISD